MKDLFDKMKGREVVVFVAGKITGGLINRILSHVQRKNNVIVFKISGRKRGIRISEIYKVLIRCNTVQIVKDRHSECILLGL